jgi:hypothetical protein
LALLALVTLGLKQLVEWRHRSEREAAELPMEKPAAANATSAPSPLKLSPTAATSWTV